jgi:hypothetical protein
MGIGDGAATQDPSASGSPACGQAHPLVDLIQSVSHSRAFEHFALRTRRRRLEFAGGGWQRPPGHRLLFLLFCQGGFCKLEGPFFKF